MPDIISKAASRVAVCETRAAQLRAALDQVLAEQKRWREFLETAYQLQDDDQDGYEDADLDLPGISAPAKTSTSLTVRKGSVAARAATYIRENGPVTVAMLARVFQSEGDIVEDDAKFRDAINSAIWRRRQDLFERKGELVHLRTKDFELVDG